MAKRGLFSLFRKAPDSEGTGPLTRDGRLQSDLWLDQPDAAERVAARRAAGELSDAEAADLVHWAERGYAKLSVDPPAAGWNEIDAAVERLWREKPATVAMAYNSPLGLFRDADEAADRRPGHRISNLHSASEAAAELYLHASIHGLVGKIFGEAPVALQSIYFEWGSGQALHRDPMHVYTSPPSHLIGAWIALEDIGPDCGPLTYVAGSHELPYYQFSPGEYRVQHGTHGDEDIKRAEAFDLEQCRRAGLEPELFTCRRGDVLLWHASLLHGGAPLVDPSLTRKSLVVHFSTKANYRRVRQTILETAAGEVGEDGQPVVKSRVHGTDRLIERAGRFGFANPLDAPPPS
jgi:ectoine hydroxylase-related dioxygenase (phytanoyl-CoA dioxygenase family)